MPRTGETSGDIRISAASPLNIIGAQTIALNAFWTYAPSDPNGTIVQNIGSGVPTGAIILDQVNTQSVAFINSAESNPTLQSKLAGLTAYGANYHLRPGVEIASATPNGNLTIAGDIDLSRYRYGPNADVNPSSPGYGAGEPGVLVIRAGGNLNIYGSITPMDLSSRRRFLRIRTIKAQTITAGSFFRAQRLRTSLFPPKLFLELEQVTHQKMSLSIIRLPT